MFSRIIKSSLIPLLLAACTFIQAAEKTEAKTQSKIKLALAGDSTVCEYKAPNTHLAGWGQALAKYFNNKVIINNFAVSGKSTKTFIAQGDWQKLLDSKPDYIMLQFGHNDSHGKDKPESTDAKTDYKENLRKFVDEAKRIGAPIILVSPMHRRTFDKAGKLSNELQPYADVMQEVAKEKNVLFIDLHTSSGKLMSDLGPEKAIELSSKPEDRSHFSPDGADKLAQLIINDLKKTDSPLKNYLK